MTKSHNQELIYRIVNLDLNMIGKVGVIQFIREQFGHELLDSKNMLDKFLETYDPHIFPNILESKITPWIMNGFVVEPIYNWHDDAKDHSYQNTKANILRRGLELENTDRDKFEQIMDMYHNGSDELREVLKDFFSHEILPMA